MRRIAALLAVLVLVIAACGDDDTGSEDTTASTAAASSTTAAPAATTTEAPATTVATVNEALEAVLELEGTYEGEWFNTTFGSTGPITIDIAVDEATGIATFTMDLGGFVFGGDDPDPIVYEVDLSDDPDLVESSDPVFGDGTFEADEGGAFIFEAPEVPGLGGIPMTIEGEVTPDGFFGTYSIPGLAEGTFEAIPSN